MRRLLVFLAGASLLLAFAAPTATATTTRHEVACTENFVDVLAAPTEWTSGGTSHMRGLVYLYDDVGDALCAGTNVAVINGNFAPTGTGVIWATGHITLASGDGGWEANLVAHLTPDGPHIWEGQIVAQGWGSLAGWQLRATVVEPTHAATNYWGVAFEPGE